MNFLASGGSDFVSLIFDNWQMMLFILLVVLLLSCILFRRFKLAFLILVIIAAFIGGILLTDFIVEQVVPWIRDGDLPKLVDFAVRWVPTVLFAVIVLVATLLGAKRGLRKSLILLAQAVGAAVVCIVIYVLCVNLREVDEFMLNFVNLFLGGNGALQARLGVDANLTSLKDVFVAWLPTLFGSTDISTMLQESAAYIYTLADLLYHVAFFIICLVVYLILDLILYIIYLCCYSERKYKREKTQKYIENKVDRRYTKHRAGGTAVGLARGLVVGLLAMSFLGTALFVVAGRGEGKLKEMDTDNDDVNFYYSLYRSVESYGTYGIFSVLNMVSDVNDSPYYLFAADLIFSGELNDENLGINENIVFREELGSYVSFARDTLALLIKYGEEDLKPVFNGEASQEAFDAVIEVLANQGFRDEFKDLINEFSTQGFVMNFAMSFVNSVIMNLDEDNGKNPSFMESVGEESKELLKILFKKGHYSDYIPDEKNRDDNAQIQPYLNLNTLVTKEDVKTAFDIVVDLLVETKDPFDAIDLIRDIYPKIRQFSMFDGSREEELDPVLSRLYCYAANRYLAEQGSGGVEYAEICDEKINWTAEINALLDVIEDSLYLYANVYEEGAEPYDMLVSLFDKGNTDYAENMAYYDDICDNLTGSRVLGKVLSTSFVYNIVSESLGQIFNDIYIPNNIVYENTFGDDGKLEKTGEIYNLLKGIKAIGSTDGFLAAMNDFGGGGSVKDFFDKLAETIGKADESGRKLSEYIVDSVILRSVMSVSLIKQADEFIYVPLAARESDANGNKVNLITAEDMTDFFAYIDELIEFINPVLDDGDADTADMLVEFVERDDFDQLLASGRILEGTVGKFFATVLRDADRVKVAYSLVSDYEGWVTQGSVKGELKKLLDAAAELGINKSDFIRGELDEKEIFDSLLSFDDGRLDAVLSSSVIHYTLSDYLENNTVSYGEFMLVIPTAAKQPLVEDVLEKLIKKSELKLLVGVARDCGLSDDTDVSDVFAIIVRNKSVLKDSYVVSASLVYAISCAESTAMLELPDNFTEAATLSSLANYGAGNIWRAELPALVNALDELLDVSTTVNAGIEFEFNDTKFENNVKNVIKDLNKASTIDEGITKLNLFLSSTVMAHNITVKLDSYLQPLLDSGDLTADDLVAAKAAGLYTAAELEALCNAIEIFRIQDIGRLEVTALIFNVKNEILTMNEPRDGYDDRSTLDIVYPSSIIVGIMSKQLDNVLLDVRENPSETSSPLIEIEVLNYVKSNYTRYSKGLISQFVDALQVFGFENFNDIKRIDFDDLKGKTDADIDKICQSKLVVGVLTKQICDEFCRNNNQKTLVDHKFAYDQEAYNGVNQIKILRTEEIRCLFEIFRDLTGDDVTSVNDIAFDDLLLSSLKGYICDEENAGRTRSYLILSQISYTLKSNSNLIIDRDNLCDDYDCIGVSEQINLIDAVIAMNGDNAKLSSLNRDFSLPDTEERREALFKSAIIRAKITAQILDDNLYADADLYVTVGNMTQFADANGIQHVTLSAEELTAISKALYAVNGDAVDFRLPVIEGVADVVALSDCLEDMYQSDLLGFIISDVVLEAYPSVETETRIARKFTTGAERVQKEFVTLDTVRETLGI